MITDLKQNTSVIIQNNYEDVKKFLDLNPDESEPLMIFDLKGHHEFKQNILSNNQKIKELKQMENALKETARLNTEKLRKKMIQDGEKNLEKRRAEIETLKLKVVELKLWK